MTKRNNYFFQIDNQLADSTQARSTATREKLSLSRFGIFLLFIFVALSPGFAQEIPDNFQFFNTVQGPKDLKLGIPHKILVDSSRSLLIICYDYNPSHLEFYQVDQMKLLKRVTLRGFTYFNSSFFDISENAVYIDKGRNKNRYVKIDLAAFTETKVKCEDTSRGCSYYEETDMNTFYHPEEPFSIIQDDRYAMKFDLVTREIEIYLSDTAFR